MIKGLYAIIDDSVRPEICNIEKGKRILAGGARAVQLRGKGLSSKELLAAAMELRVLANEAGAIFIVNDRADIALLSDADGVHLGQDDLPVSAARKIVGNKKLIGISTHSLEQALKAESEGADYLGFGPVFATKTKTDAEEAKGIDALREVKARLKIPVIAIGGINMDNLNEVTDTGADGFALISAIINANDIDEETRNYVEAVKNENRIIHSRL